MPNPGDKPTLPAARRGFRTFDFHPVVRVFDVLDSRPDHTIYPGNLSSPADEFQMYNIYMYNSRIVI